MSRLFRKYLLKYEFLQLELEDTAEFVDTKTQDWNKLFGKYQPKEREVWVNEETGEVNSVPESKQKDKPVTLPEVKKLYRNLSKHIHPDKGGSQEDFNRLKKYYDTNNIFGLIEEAGKFSIEFDVSEEERQLLEKYNVKMVDQGGFEDTAALLKTLDLLVSVDTVYAHLAGALGVPTYVMLADYGMDWRWFVKRKDSPFYNSVKLFRQHGDSDWLSVFSDIKNELKSST